MPFQLLIEDDDVFFLEDEHVARSGDQNATGEAPRILPWIWMSTPEKNYLFAIVSKYRIILPALERQIIARIDANPATKFSLGHKKNVPE